MLPQILNALQWILVPLVIGGLIVGGCAVYLIGRSGAGGRRRKAPRPRSDAPSTAVSVDGVPDAFLDSEDAGATVEERPSPPPAAPANAVPPAPLAADLLLVDDSAVVRAKLRRLFEPAGYRVALARDGREALQMLEQGRYALLVTDLEMPRLDGLGLISAAQADPALADMPIMAITGHDDLQDRLNECEAICGIYRKPWIDEDLLGHVQQLLGGRTAPAAHTREA